MLPQSSVFFHRAQWQTVSLKWILLMPVGFYCLFDLHRHPAPGTARFVIQNNADTADRTDLTYSQGLSCPPPLHIWDGFPCQLPMLSLKGSRAEELCFSDAERGCSNLSRSPCTHKIGESRESSEKERKADREPIPTPSQATFRNNVVIPHF